VIGIIGSGIAGLSAALRLRRLGYEVTVFEAHSGPGGKLDEISQDGYRFDLGPSLFTMPQYIDELFELFDENPRDHFNYLKKETLCNYFWTDGTRFQTPADKEEFINSFSTSFKENPAKVRRFLEDNSLKYELTAPLFLERSLHRLKTYLNGITIKAIAKIYRLDLFKSLYSTLKSYFKNPKSLQFFSRHATYNGSSPYQTPGIMSLIPHLEMHFGTYYPEGGMRSITESLYQLAIRNGVQFHFDEKVTRIDLNKGKVIGLSTAKGSYPFDIVVSNMDVVPTYRKLLKGIKAPEKTLAQERSSSALIFYWGIQKTFKELDLHNIFFSDSYQEEFNCIFKKKTLSKDPTVYVNISSKHTPSDAPEGSENWFVMINAPGNYGQNWEELIELSRERILNKLSLLLGENIKELIETEFVWDPRGIEAKTDSFLGALYGAASNDRMAAFLRHPNRAPQISNLYFCGGSVHPGGGIPLCVQSGKIVSELINEDYPK
jgi:phytoene desaturase